MIKFNDNHVSVGFIKQILHDFNLPTIKLCKSDDQVLFDDVHYIKDGEIILHTSEEDKVIKTYEFGDKLPLNMSKNLKINNLIYDDYTHEYLGNYLRFLRDYKDLNLMPLYNCFTNKNIDIAYKFSEDDIFESNTSYKVFKIPVKFGQKYTFAIDCLDGAEVFCGFYSDDIYKVSDHDIESSTHQTISRLVFSEPFIYDKLENYLYDKNEYINEDNLCLFLKLPFNNNSSIVILEGDYSTCFNLSIDDNILLARQIPTDVIINYADVDTYDKNILNTRLQLLYLNSKVSYPFSDKLIAYLTSNVVDNQETITDNLWRVKAQLLKEFPETGDKEKDLVYNKLTSLSPSYWYDIYNKLLLDIAKEHDKNNDNLDMLGYYDKDVEKCFEDIDIYNDMPWLSDADKITEKR